MVLIYFAVVSDVYIFHMIKCHLFTTYSCKPFRCSLRRYYCFYL
ncbi:hypothetical protein [Pseudomonas phage vB_Pa-PAC2]|nr:hypothetical protein Paride_0364 [Pseudomonas phage Paride]